ncbi:MAG: PP2C family serine/threonine-protein phosphatase [Planctomycetota bacterium]
MASEPLGAVGGKKVGNICPRSWYGGNAVVKGAVPQAPPTARNAKIGDEMSFPGRNGLQAATRTEQGPRARNEDAVFASIFDSGDWRGLFVVADGLGGHGGGGDASKIAVQAFEHVAERVMASPDLFPEEVLDDALLEVNEALRKARLGRPDRESMGTTLTALAIHGDSAHVIHTGDSRLYRFLSTVPALLTEDHNLAFRLVKEGALAPEDLATSPMRSRLYRYLGKGDSAADMVDRQVLPLSRGDRFLLTTDGCCEGASPPIWDKTQVPADLLNRIFDSSSESSLRDNASAIAVAVN